jgi:hypothetical protein
MDALLAASPPLAVDLNSPGTYLTWSIFQVSEANLILIALVGAHVLLVRVRGVSHPLPASRPRWRMTRPERAEQRENDAAPWRGPTRR